MIYLGIDNGFGTASYGFIKVVDDEVKEVEAGRLNARWLFAQIGHFQNCKERVVVTVEKAWGFPYMKTTAVFNYGIGYGKVLGTLEILDIPYNLITPQSWKKYYGVTKDKQTSIDKVRLLYGDVNLLASPRARKADHNMAEALLIASYGKIIDKDME